MRPHVTLVNPPYPMGAHQHPPFTPLGLGYLAAVLEKNQYKVDVIDCQALRFSYDDFKSELSKQKPDIVGMTSTTLTYKSALKIAKIVKEVNPNCLVIFGGRHPTFEPDSTINTNEVDIVVRGEGELTLREFIIKGTPEGVRGISYKINGNVKQNENFRISLYRILRDKRYNGNIHNLKDEVKLIDELPKDVKNKLITLDSEIMEKKYFKSLSTNLKGGFEVIPNVFKLR